ncbi:hypothetical protein CANARDRAFT_26689 [[Candida] arabinofermentans NRRL YB-2248]|uniref:Glutamyl-tRNA(Gln) amidotransferase subunit A, mitochondrial n=1 Tax=[Candida] arabinofermentans NRRL YB-2248 TaxID=983967 RepID=A0A1E4T686_9ASCO|nr:hypothetical protein CANARDRAFT_26689 [[Candida] arabinofermentans NRRL YB-2248]
MSSKISLNQLKAINSKYNIFTSIRNPQAITKVESGSLSNTTFSIKDNFTTTTEPTTCSSKILNNYISPFDSTVAKLLQQNGSIMIGKTNMDEFGMGNSTLNSFYGPTLNPLYEQSDNLVKEYEEIKSWTSSSNGINTSISTTPLTASSPNEHIKEQTYIKPILNNDYKVHDGMRIVGGSSGGSAASVCAGLVDFSIGSDTGGSIRLPSAYTSTFGFKPSYGRVSRWGLVSYAQSLDTVGVIAKDLDTVGKVFQVLDMEDKNDPTALKEGLRSRDDKLTSGAGETIKIGIPSEFNLDDLSPVVKQAWLKLLTSLNDSKLVDIYPVSIPTIKSSLPTYYTLVSSEAASNLSRYDGIRYGFRSDEFTGNEPEFEKTRSEGFGEEVKRRIILGNFSLSSYGYDSNFMKASHLRGQLIDEFNSVFYDRNLLSTNTYEAKGVDFIIVPTAADLPSLLKDFVDIEPTKSYLNDVLTIPSSLAGLPTLNIPYGGKSIGFQIMGQYGSDYKVLKFAEKVMEVVKS